MSMAMRLQAFLESHPLSYTVWSHDLTESSQHSAASIHQTGYKVAKSVLLKDAYGYSLAVAPACHRMHINKLCQALGRDLELATEADVAKVFGDCAPGAIPPAGLLYELDTIVDEALLEQDDVFFEAGDHERHLHMSQADFRRLMGDAIRGRFSDPY